MRHNLRVFSASPRPRLRRRATRGFSLLAAFLAVASLIGVMASAAQAAEALPAAIGEVTPALEAAPSVEPIGPQTATVGQPFSMKVKGTGLHVVRGKSGLPAELVAKEVPSSGEKEWEISGTPTVAKAATTVTLEVENAESAVVEPTFSLTVHEAAPSVEPIGPQTATVGQPFSMKVKGTGLHLVRGKSGLPAELVAKEVPSSGEKEWEISGTPTVAKAATTVTLEVENAESAVVEPTFSLTVHEAAPSVEPIGPQTATVGQPFSMKVKGTGLHLVRGKSGLPAELVAKEVPSSGEKEWEISGTPTVAKAATTVTLEVENAESAVVEPTFSLTVVETGPALSSIEDQTAMAETPFLLKLRGKSLRHVDAVSGLPPELALTEVPGSGETEWQISGTPTAAKPSTLVVLAAENGEGAKTESSFHLIVVDRSPQGPTASGPPSVSPGVVFSAARATCESAGWSGGTVATQWLLDGTPITGASASTFVPPRGDDGHALACRQIATANGVSTTLTSTAHTIHEQPPQPAWPISAASLHCASAVCMEQGSAPGAVGEAYQQGGSWWGSQQVRCVSAPWTSAVGSSAQAGVRALAEAHTVRVSLQRVSAAGVVTVASGEAGELGTARDELDGSPTPFAGAIVVPFGAQPFAAGELWTRLFPGAAGHPNWLAPGGGVLTYGVSGAAGAARSFQLTYTLTSADLGSHLRCVAGADDGPAGAPTTASFASPEYGVATSAACGPGPLGSGSLPQPAIVTAGEPRCLPAPSSLAALGSTPRQVAVKGSKAAVALVCALHSGCRGKLALTAVLGGRRVTLGHAAAHVANGSERVLKLKLSSRTGRALRAAGAGGLAASLQLESKRGARRVASVLLVASG